MTLFQQVQSFEDFAERPGSKFLFIEEVGCRHCAQMDKALGEILARTQRSGWSFFRLNLEDDPKVSNALGLVGTPALVRFQDGETNYSIWIGAEYLDELSDWMDLDAKSST